MRQSSGIPVFHHETSGPQFSSQPSTSCDVFFGSGGDIGGAGGWGGTGGGGVGGCGAGAGAGGVGAGGAGGGTGLAGQSELVEHFFDQSVVHRPPVPLAG